GVLLQSALELLSNVGDGAGSGGSGLSLRFDLDSVGELHSKDEFGQQVVAVETPGYAHIEGREAGRPLALAARLRQGKRTRSAVQAAASKLYETNPLLRRNDSKTAMQISGLKLEQLRKRDGTYLGADAIVKHLRAIRRDSKSD